MTETLEVSVKPAATALRNGPRQRHRPTAFIWRGDPYDFHRHEDAASLACLDRYTDQPQRWPLLSGWVITPTGAEVRDIIKQVHDLDVPAQQPATAQQTPEPVIVERVVEKIVHDPSTDEELASARAEAAAQRERADMHEARSEAQAAALKRSEEMLSKIQSGLASTSPEGKGEGGGDREGEAPAELEPMRNEGESVSDFRDRMAKHHQDLRSLFVAEIPMTWEQTERFKLLDGDIGRAFFKPQG